MAQVSRCLAVLIAFAPLLTGASARDRRPLRGTLVKLQSLDLGGYAMHLPHVLTPGQSLVRSGDYVIAIGGTAGGMVDDFYDAARLYRIRSDGTLVFVRTLPSHARALAVSGDTVYAVAFDSAGRNEDGAQSYSTTAHIEGFQLSAEKNGARVILRRKPNLRYTTFMRWLTPLPDAIAVVEIPRPGHSKNDRIDLISADAARVLDVHFVKKVADPRTNPNDPFRYYDPNVLKETVLSLSSSDRILAVRLAGDRIRLLDVVDSRLRLRHEMKLKGLLAITISTRILYAYTEAGVLSAFDVSDPANPARLWSRPIPKVPDPKGIVVDGNRVMVHGIGLTEAWTNDTHPPEFFEVGNKWKSLECVIVNGDLIYAFNGAASVSKLMVLQMKRR